MQDNGGFIDLKMLLKSLVYGRNIFFQSLQSCKVQPYGADYSILRCKLFYFTLNYVTLGTRSNVPILESYSPVYSMYLERRYFYVLHLTCSSLSSCRVITL